MLGQRGRADGEVAGEALDGAPQPRGQTSQPSRQPVIEKYFEKELTSTASREVSQAQLVAGLPGKVMPW